MCTPYYYLNLAGMKCDDEKMRHIPCPRFELYTHVTMKGIQGGALLGGAVVAPITCAVKGEMNRDSLINRAYDFGSKGVPIGAVVGGLSFIGFMIAQKPDTVGCHDRCYRIRYNKNQVFTDRLCVLGLAVGAGAAKYLGEELGKGMYFGFTSGLLAAGLINTAAKFF